MISGMPFSVVGVTLVGGNERPFRWCFVGTGSLANTVARQVVRSGRHEVVSAYSRREESREWFARRHGASAFASAEEAILAPGVDGVYVVTPHSSHHEYVRLALELGRPVLCEKAFTVNAAQAEELVALAEGKGVYLAEAMWTWFSPVAHRVRRWVDDGEFGSIEKVVANYHMNIKGGASRLTDPMRAGGALLDIGVYPITYLYRLFGNPTEVRCVGRLSGGVDLSEDVTMTFGNGLTCTASASIADFRGFERLRIKGDGARLGSWLFHAANGVTLRRNDGTKETFRADGSYLNEFDRVAEDIRAGRTESLLVPHQATLDVMRIMDECRRQMGLVYPFEGPAFPQK